MIRCYLIKHCPELNAKTNEGSYGECLSDKLITAVSCLLVEILHKVKRKKKKGRNRSFLDKWWSPGFGDDSFNQIFLGDCFAILKSISYGKIGFCMDSSFDYRMSLQVKMSLLVYCKLYGKHLHTRTHSNIYIYALWRKWIFDLTCKYIYTYMSNRKFIFFIMQWWW